MNCKTLTAALSIAMLLGDLARADAPKPLPADTVWYGCTGYGVRVVNRTMSETTPQTDSQRAIYAASISAKRMWWYWEPERQLRNYAATEIAGDRITVTQHHDVPPRYVVDGTFSLDRRQMTYVSNASAIYPDGTEQVVRGTGTCKTITPLSVG